MRTRIPAAAIAALLATGAVACSSSDTNADPTACKTAMKKQFDDAMKAGASATPATRPDACDGIDDKTAQRLAEEIMKDGVGDALESAMPSLDTDDVTATPDADDIQASLDALEDEIDDTLDEYGVTPTP